MAHAAFCSTGNAAQQLGCPYLYVQAGLFLCPDMPLHTVQQAHSWPADALVVCDSSQRTASMGRHINEQDVSCLVISFSASDVCHGLQVAPAS